MPALRAHAAHPRGVPTRSQEVYERLEELDSDNAESRAALLLSGLGFDKDMQQKPTREYSGGWRMRIVLAQALSLRTIAHADRHSRRYACQHTNRHTRCTIPLRRRLHRRLHRRLRRRSRAQALFLKPDLLLLDEPTNHLDVHALTWLEFFLGAWDRRARQPARLPRRYGRYGPLRDGSTHDFRASAIQTRNGRLVCAGRC